MKTTHDPSAYLDFPMPIDIWHSVLEQLDTFGDWFTCASISRLAWRDLGGHVQTVDHYVRLHVRSNDMWHWPQPIIKASTYFPQAVLDRLRDLPWLQLMRSHPDEDAVFANMQIAGGYVRIELIRALRAHCPGVVHYSLLHIPDKARDVDIWIKQPTTRTLRAMDFFTSDDRILYQAKPHSCAWAMYNAALDQAVEFVLINNGYYRDDAGESPSDIAPTNTYLRDIQSCVIEGFDLSCVQFAFKRDNSGEVFMTPLALYALMTGRMVMCHMSPDTLKRRCENVIHPQPVKEEFAVHADGPIIDEAHARIIGRIGKYIAHGYTLHTWDGREQQLLEPVRQAYARMPPATMNGIYWAGPYWDTMTQLIQSRTRYGAADDIAHILRIPKSLLNE